MNLKTFLCTGFSAVLLTLCGLTASAVTGEASAGSSESSAGSAGDGETSPAAEASYSGTEIVSAGFGAPYALNDGDERSFTNAGGGSITLSCGEGISSIYVVFNRLPDVWTLTDPAGEKTVDCAEYGFLHEFVDVKELFGYSPSEVVMEFPGFVSISEVYGFTEGEPPGWVQRWEPPLEQADLLLLSSHADDEHLFFAGILPYYAIERGMKVQVAYIVSHFDTYARPHEQLDGLWAVGIRNYPVMSDFPDLYSESEEQAVYAYSAYGVEFEDFVGYVTDTVRRFKPLVVVSHDVAGEYGHGTHILCSKALMEASELTGDPEYRPESAEEYGTWQAEKIYLHLYGENPIIMDWDTPLESLGGLTAFEFSRRGFDLHQSQHWTWFYGWVYGKNAPINAASEIKTYSPCKYGLFKTTVGADVQGGDFFENVKTYEQRAAEELARKEAEEKAKAEAEAKAKAEAEAKAEAARKEAEEAARLEQERLNAAAQPSAPEAPPDGERDGVGIVLMIAAVCCSLGAAAIIAAAALMKKRKRRR